MKKNVTKRKIRKIERRLYLRPFHITPGLIAFIVIFLLLGTYIFHEFNIPKVSSQPSNLLLSTSNRPSSPILPKGFGIAFGGTLQNLNSSKLNAELADVKQLGFNWIRFDIQWETVQGKGPNAYDWSAYDRIVNTALHYKLQVLPTLAYAPEWARLSTCNYTDKCAPAQPAQFATFAHTAAEHYKSDGIKDWEIWNEPNLQSFWEPAPSPTQFTKLLMATYPALKSADPEATVITGGLGQLDDYSRSIPATTFLSDMYADGAKNSFNAVGYHPYSFPAAPNTAEIWSGWSQMNDLQTSMRSVMANNGDENKLLWLTEFGAPTGGPGYIATLQGYNPNTSPDHVDEALQAAMVSQAVSNVRSSSWAGPMFWYSYKDLGTDASTNENFFGLLRADGTKKPAYTTFKRLLSENSPSQN